MTPAQLQVRAFHEAMGATIGETPAIRDAELRAKLILEEAFETVEALLGKDDAGYVAANSYYGWAAQHARHEQPNLVSVIDGLCDLQYVLLGTAVACGIDLESFFNEVHRTNMLKTTGPVREDGKKLKPPGWQPPRIAELLAEMTKGAGR